MNKNLLMAIAVGAALTGCVKNETANDAVTSKTKIGFEAPVVGSITRAVPGEIESATAYPTDENFKVWGWYHTGDYTTFGDEANGWATYMGPLDVIYDQVSTWAPATDYYWPKVGELTCAAYSPADAKGTYDHTAEGLQITDFTVENVGAQYDLLYSDRSYNRTSSTIVGSVTNPGSYTGVDIVFHHALSSIVFVAGTDTEYTGDITFKIKSITLSSVVNKGNFTQGIAENTDKEVSNPQWTASAEVGDKTSYTAFSGEFTVPKDGSFTPTGAADLLLLPQTFADETAQVTIVYTMETASSGEIEHTENLAIKNYTSVWEPNKRYTYKIIFGLQKITFAPIVENWEDVTVTPDIEL